MIRISPLLPNQIPRSALDSHNATEKERGHGSNTRTADWKQSVNCSFPPRSKIHSQKKNNHMTIFSFSPSSCVLVLFGALSLSLSLFFLFTFLESLHTYTHYIHLKLPFFLNNSVSLSSHLTLCITNQSYCFLIKFLSSFPLYDSSILVRPSPQEKHSEEGKPR